MFQGRRDTLFSGKRDILPSGNYFFVWDLDHLSSGNRTIYHLGIGPLILWESGHPLGNGTRYPLGFGPLILWEKSSGNRNLGDEVQPYILLTLLPHIFHISYVHIMYDVNITDIEHRCLTVYVCGPI